MASLVRFDPQGPFGPAMTLIYNSKYYSKQGLNELINLVFENFKKVSGSEINFKRKGFNVQIFNRNQSKHPMSPVEMINSAFFQVLLKPQSSLKYQSQIAEVLLPKMLKTVEENLPAVYEEHEEVKVWACQFIESYLTPEAIEQQCKILESASDKIMEERKTIGFDLYKAVEKDQINEQDLDAIIEVNQIAMKRLHRTAHFATDLHFAGRYLTLFSRNEENPRAFGESILNSLSTIFRQKMFPKSEEKKQAQE